MKKLSWILVSVFALGLMSAEPGSSNDETVLERGRYFCALLKLKFDIQRKTNGCATFGWVDRNDWIRNCNAQGQVYPQLVELIELLEQMTQQ